MNPVTITDALSAAKDSHHPPAGLRAGFDKLIRTSLLGLTIGVVSGALVLSPSLMSPPARVTRAAPSAAEIEQAVAQAEAQGIAAGAEISTHPGR
ncbi:hypothetical protein [Allosphingosinicella deserti]|uniref:Uncharacterized protein n=1 Tax=Allosphingosinicella deserti TaxID=2116704 RepID=A0A2P7QZ63_9SPHN|nr:hypothetical protein [Sphingomonas deserti]PSJ43243.1 hypothetical protein C7I55_02355 [Sphingomonas deserti]